MHSRNGFIASENFGHTEFRSYENVGRFEKRRKGSRVSRESHSAFDRTWNTEISGSDFRDNTGRASRVSLFSPFPPPARGNVRRGFGGSSREGRAAPSSRLCAWTRTRARVHRVNAIGVRRSVRADRRDHARSIAASL